MSEKHAVHGISLQPKKKQPNKNQWIGENGNHEK
jgi:hypothetical protein